MSPQGLSPRLAEVKQMQHPEARGQTGPLLWYLDKWDSPKVQRPGNAKCCGLKGDGKIVSRSHLKLELTKMDLINQLELEGKNDTLAECHPSKRWELMAKNHGAESYTWGSGMAQSPRTETCTLLSMVSHRTHRWASIQDHNSDHNWTCWDEEIGEKLISL